ncbi:hypothetical protein Rs2_09580 [Raphanus sativus]|nr:hypothetical protein Rs2_09580 [Raphanus sativus]
MTAVQQSKQIHVEQVPSVHVQRDQQPPFSKFQQFFRFHHCDLPSQCSWSLTLATSKRTGPTTPSFINLFAARSSASSQPCALLIFIKHDKLFVFSSPQAESYQFTIPHDGFLQRYDSVQGLIYLETSTQIMIWNPTMKQFFT